MSKDSIMGWGGKTDGGGIARCKVSARVEGRGEVGKKITTPASWVVSFLSLTGDILGKQKVSESCRFRASLNHFNTLPLPTPTDGDVMECFMATTRKLPGQTLSVCGPFLQN